MTAKHLFRLLTSCLVGGACCALALASCRPGTPGPQSAGEPRQADTASAARPDTALLRVALVPDYDCLPIYYAHRAGIFRKLGLHVELLTFESQLDCDTALRGTTVDGGIADSLRWAAWGGTQSGLRPEWKGHRRWQFMVRPGLRAHKVRALSGRTVATARQSAEDSLLTSLLARDGLSAEAVYRPQIHSLRLRAAMLAEKQFDAALIAWPYAALARRRGAQAWTVSLPAAAPTLFVRKSARLQSPGVARRWQLFEQGRRMAADSLRIKGPAAYSLLLQQTYRLPASLADTLRYE